MAFGTRMWSVGKLLALIGALIATFLLFAAASMRLALRAGEVKVPDFANRTASEATALATSLGLTIRVDESRRMDPKIGAGRILTQEPSPGVTTRRQRSVRVWLSSGPRATKVPQLVGETERSAALRLAQDGLTVGHVSEVRSQAYPSDVIVAQDPAEGSGSAEVALLVNRAESGGTYVMPDLIGVSGERAATILRGRGFRAAIVGSTSYPGIPPGVVLRQSPQAGFQIAPGEPISIEVSR